LTKARRAGGKGVLRVTQLSPNRIKRKKKGGLKSLEVWKNVKTGWDCKTQNDDGNLKHHRDP